MLAKVRKVMSSNVPRVKSSDTILEAANVMNRERTSGAAVVEGEKVVGLITERALLWKFVPLNKRPDEVSVGEMLVPFFGNLTILDHIVWLSVSRRCFSSRSTRSGRGLQPVASHRLSVLE